MCSHMLCVLNTKWTHIDQFCNLNQTFEINQSSKSVCTVINYWISIFVYLFCHFFVLFFSNFGTFNKRLDQIISSQRHSSIACLQQTCSISMQFAYKSNSSPALPLDSEHFFSLCLRLNLSNFSNQLFFPSSWSFNQIII